jgi:tetratricopeptide (TPR) repeat protein
LQLVCSAGQPVNLLHYSSQLREAIRALDRSADGIKSHECWYLLCRIYANQIPGIRNEYLKLQTWAGLAAASGKALNTRPPNELGSVELWRWRGNALCQLCLYELAFKALDQVVAIGDATKEDSHAIELCHEMMTLDEADPRRPDSPASMGLIDYHLPRTTTDPTGGPARTIAASSKKRDPRSMLEEARILAREPNGFWPAYDHFTRALHQMVLSGEARLERNHELNQKAFSLFNTNKDEAIALLCEAVAYVPADMHSWQELGTIHFHKGRFAEAEEFQQRAIEIVKAMSPLPRNSGRYWFNMADCRLHSARSNPKLAEHDRQAKLLKAAEDARLAISLGDARGHLVLRQIAKETAVSPTKKRWWKFRK